MVFGALRSSCLSRSVGSVGQSVDGWVESGPMGGGCVDEGTEGMGWNLGEEGGSRRCVGALL
jgi:hypothetical protein